MYIIFLGVNSYKGRSFVYLCTETSSVAYVNTLDGSVQQILLDNGKLVHLGQMQILNMLPFVRHIKIMSRFCTW